MNPISFLMAFFGLLASGCIASLDHLWFTPETVGEYIWPNNEVPETHIELVEIAGSAVSDLPPPTLFGVWAHACSDAEPQSCPEASEYNPDNRGGTILYLHGGDRHLAAHWDRIQILWRMGFSVFAIDYRGYGRSTGEPSEEGLYLDARDALNHVLSRLAASESEELPLPELAQLAYYGHSLGAAIAIDLAAEFNPTALLVESVFPGTQAVTDDAISLGLSSSFFTSVELDAAAKIAFVAAPKLIMHGTEDSLVRFDHAQLLYEAAMEPKRLIAVPGADHQNAPCPARDPGADSMANPCLANSGYLSELGSFVEEYVAH